VAYPGATIATSGGTGAKTFAIAGGSLPTGLAISSTTGAISGTPTGSAGVSTFTVKVTDSATTPVSVTSGSYTITVTATPLVWTSPTTGTDTYTVGTAITPINLVTTGGTGAITYSVNSGTLPAGLSIVGNQLTGTPTAPTVVAGNPVTFLATDSATPTHVTAVSATVTLIANPVPLVITSTALPTGTVGAAYNATLCSGNCGYQFTSTGGTGTITWTVSAGSLTGTGLTLSSSGLLAGTPTTVENALSLTFQAKDSATNQQQTVTKVLPLTINNALTVTTTEANLPNAFVLQVYNSTGYQLAATGGSGTGYTWSVTSGATGTNSLATLNLSVSSTGLITGTPAVTGTASFTVQVKDSASNTALGIFTITSYAALALPAANPSSLGAGVVSQSYTGSVSVSGGVPPYTWTVNSSTVPVSLGNGLNASSVGGTGNGTLNITGTPTTTTTVNFTAKVTDSTNATASQAYSISVTTNYTINGQLNLANFCGGSSTTYPGITVTLSQGSTTIQAVTSNSNGGFTFTNIPAGTYTVTPSYTATGASAVFYPSSQSIIVSSGSIPTPVFSVSLGYTVSGTATYAGSQKGQVYLSLSNTNCGGSSEGTSFTATGAFTGTAFSIRGVPPGTYTLQSFMDSPGYGATNAGDASGSTGSLTVSTASLTGVSITLSNPTTVTLTAGPTLQGAAGFNTGAFVAFKPIENSSSVEMATSYTLQWSTTSTFTAVAGSKSFPAIGTNSNVWFLNGLTNGTVYYFRAYGTSAGTAVSAYSSTIGPVTIGANATGSTVSGAVTFTGTATGPMYAGLYDQATGVFYGEYIASPVSAQAYTVTVPTSSTAVYQPVAVLDQNNDGEIDAGDLQNTNGNGNSSLIAVTGNTTGVNITLPSAGSTATVTTSNYKSTSSSGSSQSYSLYLQVNPLVKLPVAVTLTSSTNADGANGNTPTDVGICISNCGGGFQFDLNLGNTSPTVGDTYTFNVTYSDSPTDTGTLTATVSGVVTAFATNLLPNCNSSCTSASTTPTFTWTYPAGASSYTYSFSLCCSGNNNIWQIPGSNSNSNGFPSTISPSITWGIDPTGGGSTPSVSSLTLGTNYSWQLTTEDSNGNQATTQVNYQP